MRQYLIERQIPGIECMSQEELKSVARKSNSVLADLGSEIQWLHSYVVNGKTYCVYRAPDEELILEHARMTGFPCNRIVEIQEIINPGICQG
ncbi:MAG: DUF4242 domain-containing protein [Xanthomonadales bacterium]|nr:DUF4242 domain-containing protein [Xanthomonadales bacterium]NIX11916.1 DUF4242 domain-containing protein [Xanthomonadales bacterium]